MPEKNRNIPVPLSLKSLIDLKEWQKIQDNFSAITGICVRGLDTEGNSITRPSLEPRLCSQLLKGSPQRNRLCGNCLPTFLGGQEVVDKNLLFTCQSGLHNFVVPLRLNEDKTLGYSILGPVILVARKPKEEYRKIAEELNLDLEDFWSALLEINVASLQGMRSLVELVQSVCEYAINLAYENKVRVKEEVIMAVDASKLKRIFNGLLDVAFEVSRADIGSIMFLDDGREFLTIQASRGIPDEITRKSRVKLGEGISGIAAKEGKAYLIDENLKDNRIRPYLKRPNLISSMVLPIKVENRVIGVVNLGAQKTSNVRFNMDSVGVMGKLIDLVSVAITPSN